MTLTGLTGTTYTLDPTPIDSGGEGDIYRASIITVKIAKMYKQGLLTQEMEEKLRFMIENPPNESVLSQVAGTAMGGVKNELTVIMKAKDLCTYIVTITQKSPRQFRFTFVSRLQNLAHGHTYKLRSKLAQETVYVRQLGCCREIFC